MATLKERAEWRQALERAQQERGELAVRAESTAAGSSTESWLGHFLVQQFVLGGHAATYVEAERFWRAGLVEKVRMDSGGYELHFVAGVNVTSARAGLRVADALGRKKATE